MQMDALEERAAGDPAWWTGVLMRVMDGESLREIGNDYGCMGVVMRQWIKLEDSREEAYQDALEKKKEMFGEALLDRTAAAAMANVQDAQSGSGDWLDVQMWPKGLLAAADAVEFGPDGRPYKIKMDAGKHADRLGRLLGLDKPATVNVGITSLVNVLSGMPAGAPRMRPGEIEDAEVVGPRQLESVAQTPRGDTGNAPGGAVEADAGEMVRVRESVAPREQHGTPPPDESPRRSVSYAPI